jgi:hypothetical protein
VRSKICPWFDPSPVEEADPIYANDCCHGLLVGQQSSRRLRVWPKQRYAAHGVDWQRVEQLGIAGQQSFTSSTLLPMIKKVGKYGMIRS